MLRAHVTPTHGDGIPADSMIVTGRATSYSRRGAKHHLRHRSFVVLGAGAVAATATQSRLALGCQVVSRESCPSFLSPVRRSVRLGSNAKSLRLVSRMSLADGIKMKNCNTVKNKGIQGGERARKLRRKRRIFVAFCLHELA